MMLSGCQADVMVDCISTIPAFRATQNPDAILCADVLGYHNRGDGGGGRFWFDSGVTEPDNGGTIIKPNAIQPNAPGRWRRLIDETEGLSAKWFGARGDGLTDDQPTIQAAINAVVAAGGGIVYVPPGTYACSSQLNLADGVSLEGAGIGATIITFAGANEDNFPSEGCIVAEGSLANQTTVAQAIQIGDSTITLDDPMNIAEGDLLLLENTSPGSFNPARPYYHAGEFFHVVAVNNTEITIDGSAFDDYTHGNNIIVWKVNAVRAGVRNMEVIGIGAVNKAVIKIALGRKCSIDNLNLRGSQESCLEMDRCFECQAANIWARDFQPAVGLNYGISILSSQRIIIAHCNMSVRRHAVVMGAAAGDPQGEPNGQVPCRQVQVSDSILVGLVIAAADTHGCCEFCTYQDCTIIGGVTLGGDNNSLIDNKVFAETESGYALIGSEWIGLSHTIMGNRFIAVKNIPGGLAALVKWDSTDPDEDISRPGGTLRFIGNRIDMGSFTGRPCLFRNNFAETDLNIEFVDNTITRPNDGSVSDHITLGCNSNTAWRRIVVQGNTSFGASILVKNSGAESIIVHDNTVIYANQNGISVSGSNTVPWPKQFIDVCGNFVDRSYRAGIYVKGDDPEKASARVNGNVSLRSGQLGDAETDTAFRSAVYLQDLAVGEFRNNIIGDDQAAPTQLREYSVQNIGLLIESDNTRIGPSLPIFSSNVGKEIKRYSDQARKTVSYGTAPPTAGAWEVGDVRWNREPVLGGPIGWQCIATGEPGIWVVMGQAGFRTDNGPPNVNAHFVGEEFLDTNSNQWYKAVTTGSGAADWVAI